jgi:subtilisin
MTELAGPLPAWSEPFVTGSREGLHRLPALSLIDRQWAMGGSDGSGATVAIVDSGVERNHPAIGGKLVRSVKVEAGPEPDSEPVVSEDSEAIDVVGHGTACAGIVHAIAPGADIVSVRVLGPNNRTRGLVFAAGIDWAVRQGIGIVNLSLSSRSDALFGFLHELADAAYFSNVLLVCAANNIHANSYPTLFASVLSVAAHDRPDPEIWYYNPRPPVEFGARGADVRVAWRDGATTVATGNSFAAPHIAGYAARITAKHPGITPFEIKAILAATATPAP